jgi:DNA-binding NarL/FixJ family response regulator
MEAGGPTAGGQRDPGGGGRGRPVRVVVADDHALVLERVLHRLAGDDAIEVVGTAADVEELVALYRRLADDGRSPDVVLADQRMPRMDAPEATRRILAIDPGARVLVLSAHADPTLVADSLAAGVTGYLVKTLPPDELVARVRDAAAGMPVFDRRTAGMVLAAVRRRSAPRPHLSPREIEVLALAAEGGTNGDIAARLSISPETVKTHLERIFHRLEVSDRAAAVRRGVEAGLID